LRLHRTDHRGRHLGTTYAGPVTNGAPGAAPADRGDSMLRSNVTVALGTGLSRLTGFARVAVIAGVLGQQQLTDTYNFANNTPNLVYELLLGGVLTASLVPLFVQQLDEEDNEGTAAVISVALLALLVLTVVAVVASPALVHLLTSRVKENQAEVRAVGVGFARLFMPQIFFYGLIALITAMLNARRQFRGPAFAPVMNNLLVIAVVLAAPHIVGGRLDLANAQQSNALVLILGVGTTAGIAVTALALLPQLRAAGIRLVWNPRLSHPAVRRLVQLSGWTFGYVAANQVAYFIVSILALGGHAGDQSAYVNAFTFFVLPHGLLAVSLMTTFAPELATAINRGDRASFRRQMNLGLRALGLLVIPASAGYIVLARPLVATGLRRNNFSAADAALTGRVLAAFAIGLFGFSAYLFVLRGFYAMRDARTPFILNLGENAVNVILAIAFVHRWGVVGLAASYGIAYLASAVLAYIVLARAVGSLNTAGLLVTLGRYVVCAAAMALVLHVLVARIHDYRVASALGVIIGTAVYLGAVVATQPADQAARRALARRRAPVS
jgi:putative peptidoglycan lipid II flippase